MPLTIQEILADLPELITLEAQIEKAIASLPPKGSPRTAVDYAKAFGAADDGPQMTLAKLIDTVESQAAS
jgi:hypothetical protein